jgi:Tol biopolymer transport system component
MRVSGLHVLHLAALGLLFAGAGFASAAMAASLAPVSRTAESLPNDAGNAQSGASTQALSADGCRAVFSSGATNLIDGQVDLNGVADVFLRDCSTNSTTLISRRDGTVATAANRGSTGAVISPDGRYIAFNSGASDLIDGLQRNHSGADLYLFDTGDGSLRLVNASPNDSLATTDFGAGSPIFSADSSVMLFSSAASDVLGGLDQNNGMDLFQYSLATGVKTLVTRRVGGGFCISPPCTANAGSGPGAMSANGQFVAFASNATDLVASQIDVAGSSDVFLWNRATGTSVLVSRRAVSALQAAGERSESPAISADGNFVAFTSRATTLVDGQVDLNADSDVFLFDRVAGTNRLVSHLPGAPTTAPGDAGADDLVYSGNPTLSPDGALVAFTSVSQQLVPGQVDPSPLSDDLFLYERASDTNRLVSHAAGAPLTAGAGSTVYSIFTSDGQSLMFVSRASNLVGGQVDDNSLDDALMGEDVFLHTLATGSNRLLSHAPGAPVRAGRFMSFTATADAAGAHVMFVTDADDLTAAADNNDQRDAVVWSGASDEVTLLSARLPATDPVGMIGASDAVVSADGRFVAFVSEARNVYPGLMDNDSGNTSRGRDDDIFLFDRQSGEYMLVSRSAAGPDSTANDDSVRPRISGDGRYVVFSGAATDVVSAQLDTNGGHDVFLFDRFDRSVTLLSRAAGTPATTGNGASGSAEISRDGTHVVFTSNASNLIAGGTDGNDASDVFLHDIASGTLRLVSRTSGSAITAGNGDARSAVISADGRFVAYQSAATNHVVGVDTNNGTDVLLFDRDGAGNPNRLVSRNSGNATFAGSMPSRSPQISADGRFVAYLSQAQDLLPNFFFDGNGSGFDVFVFDREAGFAPNVLVSRQAGEDSYSADAASTQLSISDDGGRVAFISAATNLIVEQSDSPFTDDLFVADTVDGSVQLVSQSVYVPGAAVGAERGVISGDGSAILFDSQSWEIADGLQSTASNGKSYLHLVDAATSVLLSRSVDGPTFPSSSFSQIGAITPDGSVSLFLSPSPDIVTFDGNLAAQGDTGVDVFVFERALGIPFVDGPSDQVVEEDQSTGPVVFTVGDPDGDAADLLVTARSSDQNLVPNGNITVSGSGAERSVEVQPAAEQSGSVIITLRATDGDGNVGTASFTLEVTIVNDTPQIFMPGPTVILEDQVSGLLHFTVDDADHDEDDLLFTVASSNPALVPTSGIALAGSGQNRRLRVTPAANAFGDVVITVRAEDPDGAIGVASLELTVENVNDAPSFVASGSVVVDEDEVTSLAGWASAISAGPFEADQQLTFEIIDNSNPALFEAPGPTVSSNGTLGFVPTGNQSGTATLSLRLRDDGGIANGGSDTSPVVVFSIQVLPVNDAPTLVAAANIVLPEDGQATLGFTVDDVEDAAGLLQVTAASSDQALISDAGLVLGGTGTQRTLVITPQRDAHGTTTVELTVFDTDGGSRVVVLGVEVEGVDEIVDLVTTLDNGLDFIAPGTGVTWIASVTNAGDDTAYAVDVLDNAPTGMTATQWTCEGFAGGACGAAGSTGPLQASVTLPSGAHVVFTVTAIVTTDAVPSITYAVDAMVGPETQETSPGDNLAIDTDNVGNRVFADGFEGLPAAARR